MVLKHYSETKGQIRATNIPNISDIPGISWGKINQQNIRVEKKEDGSTNLNDVLSVSDQVEYICYGGMTPYEYAEMEQGYKHPDWGNERGVHKKPLSEDPFIEFNDSGNNGKPVLTTLRWGIVDIIFRDKNNYKKFGEIIIDAQVRNEDGDSISSIDIEVGKVVTLTFYAGWTKSDVNWINPATDKMSMYPRIGSFSLNGRGPFVRIKGLEVGGPYTVNVTGKQGTSGQVSVNIIPEST